MRTAILGAGSAGIQLSKRLIDDGKDVALIERDPDRARIAANALDCLVVEGDGSLPDTLERAGVGKASNFIALTGIDEVNIVSCSVVGAEYPNVRRVARVRNPYFTNLEPSRRSFMGVDRFINPDIETAKAFLSMVAQGTDYSLVRFSDEDLVLRTSRLSSSSVFAGTSLKASRSTLKRDFLVAALEREGEEEVEIPSGDTVPREGDLIYLLGAQRELEGLLGKVKTSITHFRKIVIAGGGAIGRYVAEGFLGEAGSGNPAAFGKGHFTPRKNLVIVEPSMELCRQLSRDFPQALVVNRSISDEDIFLEECLAGADLLIALTPSQELNLLSAARSKEFGVERALALSENNSYVSLAQSLKVDGIISVKSNLVSSIVEFLQGGSLTTLHSFFDRGLKILEFAVAEKSRLDGVLIRDLRLPKGSLVIFVNRRGKASLPKGDTLLAAGDRLGIFTRMEAIRQVEELFLGKGA